MNDKKVIIYKSVANIDTTIDIIQEMLLKAKRFNAENEITGFILHANARFIQLFEGKTEIVSLLYDKIRADVRHHDVETLLEQNTDNSIFSDWNMAYYDFSERNEASDRKRLLLESYLSQTATSKSMENTLLILRTGINEILEN